MELPISLNYSSNGLKVDEMPTKTGMSWVLNAGGVITRTVYDKPDEMYARAGAPPPGDLSTSSSTDLTVPAWLENIVANHLDTQFDEYNFNFNGYSGKFIVDLNNNPVQIPYSNLKIELSPLRITTPDGVQYYFGENGATESSQVSAGSCSKEDSRGAKSAWYLTRIVDPKDPSDFITISYLNGGYAYTANFNHTITYWDASNVCTGAWSAASGSGDPCGCGPTPCIYGGNGSPNLGVDNFCQNRQIVSIPYINEITSSLYGKIRFVYTTSYSTTSPAVAIDRLLAGIQVFQNNDGTNLLKSFNLNYTLAVPVNTGQITSLDNMPIVPTDMSARPFLSTVQELDNTNAVIKTHSFEYNDINNLTARLSSSQDAWGYYNGKSNPNSFIPSDGTLTSTTLLPALKIADRTPDYNYASKGILNKVNFPTGGYIKFVYEGNAVTQAPPSTAPHYKAVSSVQATNSSPSATFLVTAQTTISITRSILCCSGGANVCALASNSLVWGQLNGSTSPVVSYSFGEYNTRGECSFSRTDNITLQPGTYGLAIMGFDNYQLSLNVQIVSGNIYIFDSYVPTTAALNTYLAGLRVKQQIAYDPITNQTTTTNYQYGGIIIPYTPRYVNNISYKHTPYLWQTSTLHPPGTCVGAIDCASPNSCNYIQFSSNSSINAYGRGGSPVYYASVTESIGDNFIAGGTEHIFTYIGDANLNLLRGNVIPNTSAPSYGWKNGLETKQNIFKMVSGNKVYLKKITNTYIDDSRINNVYMQYITKQSGVNEIITTSSTCPASSVFNLRMSVFDIMSYPITQQWTYLSTKQEVDYDMNGANPITNTTNYYYDNPAHAMVTRISIQNSKGENITTNLKYPLDYSISGTTNNNMAQGIQNLQNNYVVNPVIEQYVQKSNTDGSNLRTVSSIFKSYKPTIPYPDIIYSSVNNQGMTNFTPSSVAASNSTIDGSYQPRISFDNYDANGNLLQQHKINDANHSYIWDYNGSMPIAEAVNAANSDIAYTSFESNGSGNWTIGSTTRTTTAGITGSNSYSLNSDISKSGLTGTITYVVSYWTQNQNASPFTITGTLPNYPIKGKTVTINGTTWTYYEHKITGQSSISLTGTGPIDELRLYPADAQMTSYAYAPMLGVTSQDDASGKISYYEYDSLGRLKDIKDQDGNIIKTFDYHYLGGK